MKSLNAFHLKTIAIVAMFINHLGHAFEYQYNPNWWSFTYLFIGLWTFPIMAYLLVEGFFYTRNRWKYAGRLAFFACVAFIPFQGLFMTSLPLLPSNNILFTLLVGVLLMMACEKVKEPILQLFILLAAIVLTSSSDWMLYGIPIIFFFYKYHGNPKAIKWILLGICLAMTYMEWPLLAYSNGIPRVLANAGILLVIPMLLAYNGQRGYSPNWVKWGFYAFYPLHLALLWGVRYLVFGY